MAIYDCFTFFDELDILEIRLAELDPVVDFFVLAESTETFSGMAKPLHFMQNRSRFAKYLPRIIHLVVDDLPNDQDAWGREAFQRNALLRGLTDALPTDIIMLSDVDEIPFRRNVAGLDARSTTHHIQFIECDYYQFRLNLAIENKWVGLCAVRATQKRHLPPMQEFRQKKARQSRRLPWKLNQLISMTRNSADLGVPLRHGLIQHGGWHFTSIGSARTVQNKIASYAHQERNTAEFNNIENLERLLKERRSICGRRLRQVPLEALPEVVRTRPARWAHLLQEYDDAGWLQRAMAARTEAEPQPVGG